MRPSAVPCSCRTYDPALPALATAPLTTPSPERVIRGVIRLFEAQKMAEHREVRSRDEAA